jgi:hypothetical protein
LPEVLRELSAAIADARGESKPETDGAIAYQIMSHYPLGCPYRVGKDAKLSRYRIRQWLAGDVEKLKQSNVEALTIFFKSEIRRWKQMTESLLQ